MKKKWLRYIIIILFMCCFIFSGKASLDGAQDYMKYTLRMPFIWLITNSIVLYIGFGFLLGLNHLLKEKIREGKWRVNLSKIIIMGIPSLILSYAIYIVYLLHIPPSRIRDFLLTGTSTYMILFKVLLGYVVATSFYKESSAGETDVKK